MSYTDLAKRRGYLKTYQKTWNRARWAELRARGLCGKRTCKNGNPPCGKFSTCARCRAEHQAQYAKRAKRRRTKCPKCKRKRVIRSVKTGWCRSCANKRANQIRIEKRKAAA